MCTLDGDSYGREEQSSHREQVPDPFGSRYSLALTMKEAEQPAHVSDRMLYEADNTIRKTS